jgi:hypothetical protein
MKRVSMFLAAAVAVPSIALAAEPFRMSWENVKVGTFKPAGKIGLWTTADSQTYLAGLEAKEK